MQTHQALATARSGEERAPWLRQQIDGLESRMGHMDRCSRGGPHSRRRLSQLRRAAACRWRIADDDIALEAGSRRRRDNRDRRAQDSGWSAQRAQIHGVVGEECSGRRDAGEDIVDDVDAVDHEVEGDAGEPRAGEGAIIEAHHQILAAA